MIIKLKENTIRRDTAKEINDITAQIYQLEYQQVRIINDICNYKIPFGKYTGKKLIYIVKHDPVYFKRIIKNNKIPFTINEQIYDFILQYMKPKSTMVVRSF